MDTHSFSQERDMGVSPYALAAIEGLQCEITECGLIIEEGLPKEQWEEIGNRLGFALRSLQWVVGDWYLYGEQQWGHKYDDCEERFGLAYGTVANCVSVARRFEFSRRREKLSFSHHFEVAKLPNEDQEVLLDKAESESISVKDLREHKKRLALEKSGDIFTPDAEEPAEAPSLSKGDEESKKIVDEFHVRVETVADNGIYTMDTLGTALSLSKQSVIEFIRMCEVAPSVQVIRTYGRKGLTQYQLVRTKCVSATDRIRQLAERIQTDPSGSRVKSDAAKIIQLLGG
jgi:hypothetical protein